MTSLQNLLAEFKGEYSCGGPRCPHEIIEEHDVFTYKQLDDFAANILFNGTPRGFREGA